MHTESPSATNVATSSKDKQARSLFGRKKPKAKPGPNAPSTAAADDELLDLHNFEDLEFERDHQIVLDNELAWKLQEEENQAAMNALLTPSESLEFVAPSPALPPKPIAYTTPYLPVNGVKIVKTPMSMKPDEVTSPTFPGQKPHEQPQTHKPDEASYFPPTSTSTSTPTPTPRPRVSSISPLASIRTSVAYSKPAPPAPTPISSPAPSHAPTIPVNFPTPVVPNIVPPTHHLQSSYTQPHQPPPPVQHAPFLIQTPVMGCQAQLYPQIQEAAYPPIGYNTHYSPDTPVASHVKPVQTPNYGFSMMYLNRNNGVGQSPAVDLSNMVDVKVAVEDAPNDDDELVQKTEKMHPPAVPFRRRAASMSSEKEQVDMHYRRPFSTQVSTLVIQRHVETDETDDDNFPRHSSATKMSTAARYTKSLYGGNDESRPAIPTRQPSIRPPPPLPSPPVIEEGPAKLTITTVTSIPATRPKPPPKQSPTVAPKPSPKPSPKQSPTVAPKPSPKPSLKQSPTVAPKPSPKHSPTVAPKPPPKTSPTVAPKPSPDADSATRSRHTSFHQIMPTEPIHNPFTDPTEIPDDPQPLETETYDHTPHPHQQHWTSTPSAEVYEDHTSSPHQQHWNSTPSAEVYEDHTSSPHQQHWNAEVYEDHTSSPHQQHWDSTPSAEVYEDHTSSLHQQHWNSTPSAEVYEDHTSSPHQQHWTPTPSAEVYEDNTSSPHQQHWTSTPSAEVYEDHTPSPHQQHWTSTPSAEVYEDHAPSPHQQHQHWISTPSAEVYEDHTPSPHQQHWTSAPSAEVYEQHTPSLHQQHWTSAPSADVHRPPSQPKSSVEVYEDQNPMLWSQPVKHTSTASWTPMSPTSPSSPNRPPRPLRPLPPPPVPSPAIERRPPPPPPSPVTVRHPPPVPPKKSSLSAVGGWKTSQPVGRVQQGQVYEGWSQAETEKYLAEEGLDHEFGYVHSQSEKSAPLPKSNNMRHIIVDSINKGIQVWIKVHPTDTGRQLAVRIETIATFRTRRVTGIFTAAGKSIPLDNTPLFSGWDDVASFIDGEQWRIEFGEVDKSVAGKLKEAMGNSVMSNLIPKGWKAREPRDERMDRL